MNLKTEIGILRSDVLDNSAILTYKNNWNYRVKFSQKVKITERYASTDSRVISYLQNRRHSKRGDKPVIQPMYSRDLSKGTLNDEEDL